MPRHTHKEMALAPYQIEVLDFNDGDYHRRTLVGRFFTHDRAKAWAEKFGSILSCQKVEIDRYRKNIEHLNLHQESIEVEASVMTTSLRGLDVVQKRKKTKFVIDRE
jgi:hypothetical protein